MRFIIITIQKLPLLSLLLILSSFNVTHAQSSDDYLKLLEGEAKDLNLDTKTNANVPKPSTLNPVSNSSTDGNMPPGLSIEEFLQHLKVNYIGTYLFAKRLNTAQQNEIYSFYNSNNDPQAIRTEIIKISKKK